MEEKEKGESDISLNMKLTGDKSQLLILDSNSDSLVARLSFYDELRDAYIHEDNKLRIGHHLMTQIYRALYEQAHIIQPAMLKEMDWAAKASAFKSAYDIQEHKNEVNILWLMTTILGLPEEEAKRRCSAGMELLSHPEFKDKESIVIDKIYASPYLEKKVEQD
jgi:hypothetical protein